MILTPHDHQRTFLSHSIAEKRAEFLELHGAEDVHIWSRKDAFNQTEYIVCWNDED